MLTVLIAITIKTNAQWVEPSQVSSNSQNVYSLASDGTNIFAGTGSAGVSLSTNDANSWAAVNNGLTSTGISAFAISGSNIFAGGTGIFLSSNNGGSWTPLNNGLTNTNVLSLAISGNNIFAGTNASVFLSTNNGGLWTAANTGCYPGQISALAVSGINIFAGAPNNGVYLSSNNGGLWTHVSNGLTNMDVHSLTTSGTTIFAGTSGGVFISTNNGTLWTAVNNGLTNLNINSLLINGTTIFAGTDDGVFYSNNMGTSWSSFNSGFPANTSVRALTISGTYIFAGIVLSPNGVWRRPLSEATGIVENRDYNSLNLYPNPFSSTTTLQTDKVLKDAILTVYNSFGQQVKQIKNISGQTITLNRDNLPSGFYFIHVTQDNKVISSDKLIITD